MKCALKKIELSKFQRVITRSPHQLPKILKEKHTDENIVASVSVDKDIENNLNPGEHCSSGDDFVMMFTRWLVQTNGKIDASTFSRIKGDLCQIVGKYELEFAQKK